MVRETRHLWVGNLPETVREDRIREHFKRYGRVQSVKILSTTGTSQSGAYRTSQPNNNSLTLLSNPISAPTTATSTCGGQNKEQASDSQHHNSDDHLHNFNHHHHQQQINGGAKYNEMLLGSAGQATVHHNNNNNNINSCNSINSVSSNSGNCPSSVSKNTSNSSITLFPNDGKSIGPSTNNVNINSHYHVCATVSFMDIKSASKAHNAEHKFDDRILTTEYYEPSSPATTLIGRANKNSNIIMSLSSCGGNGSGNGGLNNNNSNSNSQINSTSASTSNSLNNNINNGNNSILQSVNIGQTQQYSTSNCITRFAPNHGSSDDHSPSGFDRNNFYERNTARSSVSGDQEQYIRRPNNYHHSGDVRGRTRDRLYRNGPYSASIVDRTNQVGHHRVTPSSTWYDSGTSSTTTSSRNVYGNVASAVVTPDSGYDVGLERRNSNNDDILTIKKSSNKRINKKILLRSGSESPPSCGGESGDSSRSHSRSPSSCSSTNSTTSNSNESGSPNSGTDPPSRSRNIQSAVSAPTPNTSNPNPVVHSEDNRPLAICVRNLPARSSDTSLKDGLFHEYKKHGKVTWVKVVGQSTDRYALVCFKKPDDVEKALEVSHDKLFFGCKIEVEPYQGYDVDDNEFRPYEAELDEYHPKSTRTLFIGNLEKDITANDLRKHFECFGEIIEIDIKKQGVTAYAFCQYSDIISVVKAMRKMDGEHLGNNRIKLGFGKSMPTNCVWIDGISDSVSENYLTTQFNRFGPVSQVAIDRDRKLALVFFEQIQYAQTAVKEMRGITLRGRKLQVDFASRECQEAFYEKLDKPLERDRSLGFETVREVSTRGFETTVSVPGARYSRYDTPSRSRTSSFSRHSNISSSGAASPSNSGGNTPRGPSRTSRVVRYPADYYDNVGLEFPSTDGRRFKSYDEYSQGSGASHDEIYDHEAAAVAPSTTVYLKDRLVESPPPMVVGQVPMAINPLIASTRLSIVEPEVLNATPTTPTTMLAAGATPLSAVPLRRRTEKSPGDIRHLQKERSHLLEQLEECPSSSSDEQLFSPKKRIKFDNPNQTITGPPLLLQSSRAAIVGGDCVNNSVSSGMQQPNNIGNVIDTINVQNNSVVNQLSLSNSNNNSDSICDSSSSSNLLLLTQLSIDHIHRKSVEIRRLSECSSGQKFLSSNTNSNTINSSNTNSNINSNNNSRRPSTDNLLLSRRCDDHSLLNVYPSSHHNMCKRRKTSLVSETEYHHSSRGRGHQLHSHHSHEASGGESADGSRPGTPLCDERPENITLIIPTEPRRIPTARDRIPNNEPLSLPLPKFALQMFQNRLFTGPILSSGSSTSSLLVSVSSTGAGIAGGGGGSGGIGGAPSSAHHSSASSSSSSSLQHSNHQASLNSLTLSSPPPHHHHHHHPHHHHHHHHHLSNNNSSNNQSSPKVLPPLNITQLNSNISTVGGGVSSGLGSGIEQPPSSPSRAPSLSSNSSDSEMAPTGSPSLEERIKTLDEMFERWSGNNTNRGSSLTNVNNLLQGSSSSLSSSSHPEPNSATSSLYLRHKFFDLENEQPSDILKSVLAKKSIFDDDLKRLENIGDKYEPREFTSYSRSVTNLTSSIASGGCLVSVGVSSSLVTTSTPTPTSVGMNTKPPITTTTSSSINQAHLQQRLVGGHHTTTSSPMNSPQPISPYNSPSPSPNVVNSTIKNCVVIPKGLQYPFPSHPPNNSSSTIISSSSIITTTTLSNVTTVTTSNVASSPKPLNRSMPITKSVSLTEKSSSLTNISGNNTRILNKSTSVPGSTNTGTIKIPTTTASSSSSSLKDDNSENENICSNKSRRSSADLSTGTTQTQTISKSAPIATQSTSSSNSSSSSLSSSSSAKQSANNQINIANNSTKKDDKTLPSNNSCSINKSRECLDRRKTFDEELPPNPENVNENEVVVKVDKEKPKKSKEELPQMQQTQRNNSSSSNYSTKEKEQITKEKEVKEEPTEKEKEKDVIKIENEKIDEKSKENYYVNDEFSQLKRRERNSSSSGSISGSGAIGSKRRISDTNEADELKRIRMNNEHRKVVDRRDSRDQQKSHHKQHKSSSSSTLHKQSCNPSNKSKENENLQVNSVNNQQSNLLLSTFDLIRKEVVEDKQQHNLQPQQSLKLSIDDQNKSIHKQKRKELEFDQFDSVHFLENLDARSSEDDQALLAQHQQNKEKRKEHKKKQREMEQRDDTNIMGSSPLTEQTEERRRSDSCSTNKNIENRKSSSSSSGSSSHRNNNNNEDHHSKSGSDRKSGSSRRSQERLQHQQQKIHRLLNSSDDSDSDSLTKHNRQHSIFDIPDEGPTYISMYDKVKARSCKNMQKQEEEKKIKAKFNQLKQSRAKREEKKRSTSWDEDSDSDFDQERRIRRHNHKSNKSSFIASSSDEDNERRHLHVQLDFNTSDSEADQLARLRYKHEHDCGDTSDSSMIQHGKPRRKITSRKSSRSQGRIHFDTSDDEYHSGNQKPSNHIKSESDESKEMASATDVPSEPQSSNKHHNDISVKIENDMPESDVDMVKLKSIKLEPGLKSNNSSDDENKIVKIVNPSATVKQESKENLSDIGMSGGDNITMSVKDPFDQLFSPETRRKHKKKQKRQKSLPPAIEIKIEKQDESSNHKLETQSPPLSGNSIDFNKTDQQQVSLIEKTKKHSSKKEKRREKEYDSSSKERSKDERKMKKSKKSKSSDGYSFEQHNEMSGNTISISSTNKRGEKMEDIFGPITDEDSDHSTEISNTNDAPNKTIAQENTKHCETFEEDKNNENESGISKVQPSDVSENEFKAPPIEQPNIPAEKERHREESRKRKEKKRKEKEKLRAAMLHTEDDNSVDLDEAGRALEAQLMEDCDSKSYDAVLTENQKSSENKTSNVEVTSDLFRYSGENDENSEVLNISDSKHDSTMQDGHRIKEKKKKKKRSKEEKHQKREHHHHHSSSSISSSTPIKKEPPLPIKIPDTNVELSGGNLNKQSPSLPCLIEDSPPRSNITSTSDHPVTSASPTKLHVENKRSKHEPNFIPGFGGVADDKIHESAVESLSKELENAEKLSKIEVDEPSPMLLSLPPAALKTSKCEEKTEEKSRVVISQEETEDAVAALLGESFGTSNAEDYNDCYGIEPENLESSPPNPVETVIPEEDAEEMRKALESLNAEELDIKPDTPQSENDLRIDTDTEDQEEESVNQFKFNNPPKTPDVDLTQILRTVIEKQSTGSPLVPTAQKELEVKQQIITITSTASVVKSDSVVTSAASIVSSAPSLPRSESSIVTTQPPLNTTIVAQKVVQPVRSSSITITKSSLSKPSISPTRLSTIRPQQFTIAGGTQPQTIQQHISRANTQFIMQPPTISIPEQQHIIYSPLGVMVSPRPAEPTRVHSPRTQVPQQPQFQCPEAIKRTNSPQSPNIIRSQNPRMSPQLSPVMPPHSVVVQQRLSSPSTHQSVMTTGGVISTQSQQHSAQQSQPNSGQTNILINRMPVTPILAPIAQKTAGGTNIVLQQGSNQPQKTVNVVLSQNQKLTPPVSMTDAIMTKVQPTIPQPTVVTYSTTVRVVPVTTPSQQMQGQQPQQAQQQPKTLITTLPQNTIINQQIKQTSKMIESKMNVSNTQSPQQQVVTSQNSQIMFQQQKQLQQHQMFQHQKILQQHNFANQQHAILKQQQQQIHQQQHQMQQQKIVISTKPTVQQPAQSQNIMLLPQSKLQPVQTSLHVHQPQSLEKVQQPAQPQTMQHHVAQPKEMPESHNNRQHSSIIVCQNISKPQTPQNLQAPSIPAIIPSVQSPKAQSPQIAQPPQNSDNLPIVKAPLPPQQQSQPPQPTHQPPVQPPPPPPEPVPDQKEVTKPIIPEKVEKPSEVEEIVGEIELGKKECPIVLSDKVAPEKPVEQSQPQILEKPQEPQQQTAQLEPTNVPKSMLTEENLTKLTNSQEDAVEQDSKEDSDYWSAKEVNIESVIKKVDALCSGEDTSEESSEITKEEWNEEKSLKTQKPLELPQAIGEPSKEENQAPPAPVAPSPAQEEKQTSSPVIEQSVSNTHEDDDFDEGVGEHIDKEMDKTVQRKGGRSARGKKDTQRTNHNNNNKIVIQTGQPQEPYIVQHSQSSTSTTTSGGVQTRRGGKATNARRGRGGKQSGRHSISNATPDDRKQRNTNSESDVYEFNEDSGEEVRPRLILTIKSPNVIVSNHAGVTPQVTLSVSQPQSTTQSITIPTTTTASTTVQKPTVSTQPAIVVPSSLPPNMHDNKEDFHSPALNTRKSRRLQERDGSRNTVDDVIEDVVRNLSTSPKGPQTGNSPPASLTPPRRSTRQTATIKPPPAVPVQSDKLSVVNVVAGGDIRKSPRANRVKGKDRKTSETSTDSSDEKPRSEDKSMPDLSTDVVKTTTTDVTPTVENVVEETKAIPNETNEPTAIKVAPVLPQHSVQKTPEPSEPTTLIDPVTGELMVMRQSKEGQYIPVPGAPAPKVPTPPEVIKVPSSVAETNPTAHNKPVVPVTSQSLIVSPVSNIQKQQSQSQVVLPPPAPPTPKQTPIIVSTASQSNMSPVIMATSVSSSPKVQQSTPQLQTMQLPQQQPAQYPQVQHNLPPKVSTPTQQTHQTTPAVVNSPSQIIQQTQPLPQQPQPQTKPMTLKSHVLNSTQLHKVTNPQVSQQHQTLPTIVPQNLPNLSNHIQPQQKITKLNVSGMPPMPTQGQPLAQQLTQPNTIVINSNAVNMKSLQQSGLSALSNQQQMQQQIALQQQQLQHHSHIQMPQKPQITQNIPHNLLVNVNHPMNSAISQATLSPRMKLQPQQQSPQPQPTQQSVPGQSQSIPQHIHKISMPQSGHPTHIQQQQLPPQQSSQPQLVIHSSGKISSPQSIYSPAKIVHPGQTIQISARNPPEQIIIKQPPISSQQHQIVKQALPTGSIHHVQQQQQQVAQSSTSAHMHSSTKVVQQPIHLQNQSPVHHIITTPTPAHHQPPPQAQQTTSSTNLHSVKPAHQQQITAAAPPPTKQLLGRHQTPQILTGSVASPPLKQQHHHSVVTVSNRATIPPISPQEQSRVHALQSGLPNPAYEASLHKDIGGYGSATRSQNHPVAAHQQLSPITPADVNYSPIRTVPREHLMMYQYYKAQEMGHGARVPYIPRSPMLPGTGEKPDISDMDETTTGTSPPLELRRPTSGPRTTVPHSLQSPQDRATDSPQVAQVYVHGARIPHPHFPDANARFHEVPSRAILAEPPPAHHHQSQHQRNVVPSYTAQQTPPTNLTSHIHPQAAPQIATPIIDKEREQREREQQRRERERTSIPGYTNVPSHVPAPTTGRNLQVATPPHASQVPPQGDSLLMLLQRYPVMWQGLLALKNDQAAVQMHFVFGNPQVATDSLPCNSDGSTPPLRIAQRMRLEQSQLDGVSKKMQTDNEHCMLLALPCGRDHMDVLQQSKNLQSGFITYLQQKQAAGIVNIAAPGSQQAAYVVHIFPSCEFANENLARIAPDLLHRVAEIAHLLIIIATV